MQHLLNMMKAQAAAMDAARGQPRWGIVSDVDPVNHLAKVTIQPEGTLSGWLPVSPVASGGGWGLVALPQQGQQVMVIPDCGDAEHGIIIGGGFSAVDMPPAVPSAFGGEATPGQPGELLLVSSGGAVIRACLDSSIYTSGTWNHEGNLTVQGNVAFSGGTLTHDGTDVSSTHRHSGVMPGGGDTGTPVGGVTGA